MGKIKLTKGKNYSSGNMEKYLGFAGVRAPRLKPTGRMLRCVGIVGVFQQWEDFSSSEVFVKNKSVATANYWSTITLVSGWLLQSHKRTTCCLPWTVVGTYLQTKFFTLVLRKVMARSFHRRVWILRSYVAIKSARINLLPKCWLLKIFSGSHTEFPVAQTGYCCSCTCNSCFWLRSYP